MKSVLVLGAGFAGLELATCCPTRCPTRSTSRSSTAVTPSCSASRSSTSCSGGGIWPACASPTPTSTSRPSASSGRPFSPSTPSTAASPQMRATYEPDILVVALGADLDPAATPGMVEEGSEFYTVEGAARVRDLLPSFEGGDVIIGVLGQLLQVPGRPVRNRPHAARLPREEGPSGDVDHQDRSARWRRPSPFRPRRPPASSRRSGERDIEWWPQSKVTALDPPTKIATLEDGQTMPYGLFLGIPVHRAPRVVEDSALAEDGWIPVDHRTFATKFENVYAVGDVTSAPVPRVGAIAEGEARTLAEVLIHQIKGGDAPDALPGKGDLLHRVRWRPRWPGSTPTSCPDRLRSATSRRPRRTSSASKVEFGASRRRRWFGID